MSQIDVTTHWRSPKFGIAHPVRLRIIEDEGKILALISAPSDASEEVSRLLNQQLDFEFEDAAISIAAVFSLKPLETIWLRELTMEGRPHLRRVIMDEKNGLLINARSGVLTPWESSVIKNKNRLIKRSKSSSPWRWSYGVIFGLILMLIFQLLTDKELKRSLHQKEGELQSTTRRLEEMSQKVLMIDLIEKERQQAEGAKSSLKRIYRQTTNVVIKLPPPEKKNPPLSSEPKKNWVELWNEQLFKPIPLREEEKR